MEKILNCKCALAIVGMVLGFLAMLQEHIVSGQNAWVLAIGIAVVCGAFVEVMNMIVYGKKFNAWNPVSWVAGSVVAVIVSLIIW